MTVLLLVGIGWMYVVVMMSVAEAMASNGTVIGALMTLLLYGVAPLSLALYLLGTPGRRRRRRAAEAAGAAATAESASTSASQGPDPHGRGHAAADTVPPVREEP